MHPSNWPRYLLGNLDLETFRSEHWQKKPRYIPGEPDRFHELGFDRAAFESAACERVEGQRLTIKAQFMRNGVHREFRIRGEEIPSLYEAGLTTCIKYVHQVHEGLRKLVAGCKVGLQYPGPVFVNAYLSPAGGGFGRHFDPQSSLIVQLEGSKRWKYSSSAGVPHTPSGVMAFSEGLLGTDAFKRNFPEIPLRVPEESELEECELRAGDVLYLPSGTWHRPQASDHSLALNLSFGPSTTIGLFTRAIERLKRTHVKLREFLPPGFGLSAKGSVPQHVELFLSERLDEMKRQVNALTTADLAQMWRDEVEAVDVDALASELEVSPMSALRRTGEFSWKVERSEEGEEQVVLTWGKMRLGLPLEIEPFLVRLSATSEFVAKDAMAWDDAPEGLSWDEAKDALEALGSVGLIAERLR